MVSSKSVCFREKPVVHDEDPPIVPFKEPDGMYSIDLNNEKSEEKPKAKDIPNGTYCIKILLFIIAFTITGLITFIIAILIKNHGNPVFTYVPAKIISNQTEAPNTNFYSPFYQIYNPENKDKTPNKNKIKNNVIFKNEVNYPNKNILQQILSQDALEMYKNELTICTVTQTLEDCCNIFVETDFEDVLELCTVEGIIDVLLENEIGAQNIRLTKRETKDIEDDGFLKYSTNVASKKNDHFLKNDNSFSVEEKTPVYTEFPTTTTKTEKADESGSIQHLAKDVLQSINFFGMPEISEDTTQKMLNISEVAGETTKILTTEKTQNSISPTEQGTSTAKDLDSMQTSTEYSNIERLAMQHHETNLENVGLKIGNNNAKNSKETTDEITTQVNNVQESSETTTNIVPSTTTKLLTLSLPVVLKKKPIKALEDLETTLESLHLNVDTDLEVTTEHMFPTESSPFDPFKLEHSQKADATNNLSEESSEIEKQIDDILGGAFNFQKDSEETKSNLKQNDDDNDKKLNFHFATSAPGDIDSKETAKNNRFIENLNSYYSKLHPQLQEKVPIIYDQLSNFWRFKRESAFPPGHQGETQQQDFAYDQPQEDNEGHLPHSQETDINSQPLNKYRNEQYYDQEMHEQQETQPQDGYEQYYNNQPPIEEYQPPNWNDQQFKNPEPYEPNPLSELNYNQPPSFVPNEQYPQAFYSQPPYQFFERPPQEQFTEPEGEQYINEGSKIVPSFNYQPPISSPYSQPPQNVQGPSSNSPRQSLQQEMSSNMRNQPIKESVLKDFGPYNDGVPQQIEIPLLTQQEPVKIVPFVFTNPQQRLIKEMEPENTFLGNPQKVTSRPEERTATKSKNDQMTSETEIVQSKTVETTTERIKNMNVDIMSRSFGIESESTVKPEESTIINESKTNQNSFLKNQTTNLSNNKTRSNQDFSLKGKQGSLTPSEDMQTVQQTAMNPCFYPYPTPFGSPYRVGNTFDSSQFLKVIPSQSKSQFSAPFVVMNPSVYSYIPPQQYIPAMVSPQQQFGGYGVPMPQMPMQQPPVQVSGPGGQYYMCNPIPAPSNTNMMTLPGVEIRSAESGNLQDKLGRLEFPKQTSNRSREAALDCPMGQASCGDGSKCINSRHVCDNEVNCDDGSDEIDCTCRQRVGQLRLCDGYFDCPNGEDERGCFECDQDEFSCDDWSKFRRGTCISISQRCDGKKDCEVTGKDEDDCSILTDRVGEQEQNKISNAVGFLHRNYKGKWYPTCFGTEMWARDVCVVEAGPNSINPKSHMMLTMDGYNGPFLNILPNNEVSIVNTCVQDRAAFVQCPPIFCGLRLTTRNPYRSSEVDTAFDDMITNHLGSSLLLEKVQKNDSDSNKTENLLLSEIGKSESGDILGNSRIVGGKASQVAAWPWVVSIYKNGLFHCGGVIINELWVLTAAHCVDRYWQYYYEVQAGTLRRFSYSPMEQTRWVVAAIPHAQYDKSNLKNDIALVRLSSPIRYNRYVRPICLPSETTAGSGFLKGPPPNTICTTVGWGATVEHGADPDHMREVEIPVLSSCKHIEDEEGDEICAGLSEGGKDACQGDSGGPFMCRNPNNPSQWYLAGIVSHGEGCARPNEPGVYTKVSNFLGWVADNMRDEKMIERNPLQTCPGYICKGTKRCIPKKRRCDRIVDCFMGDDEQGCEEAFHEIFKHAMRTFILGESLSVNSTEENQENGTTTLADNVHEITTKKSKALSPKASSQEKKKRNFRCKKLLQVIPWSKYCNKKMDCEDGTDETDCLCVDYLKHNNSNSICDGVSDCLDKSDELNCENCDDDQYHCKESKTCISKSNICDGKFDCPKKDDEWDCVALTNGVTLTLDSDLRPNLSMNGIITINRLGVWRPLCTNGTDKAPSIAANVCNLLGFEEYAGFKNIPVGDKEIYIQLQNTKDAFKNIAQFLSPNDYCNGLYVWCSDVILGNKIHGVFQKSIDLNEELYTTPWNAIIFSDGNYKCMGSLINQTWVLTSKKCFNGILRLKFHYVTVMLGKGTANLDVESPHEQAIRVTQSIQIENTDIVLLRLEHKAVFNRYVQPAHILVKSDTQPNRKETCVVIGEDNGDTKYIILNTKKLCREEQKCFQGRTDLKSLQTINKPWAGAIVCESGRGWYPSAIFNTINGLNDFKESTNFTNINNHKDKILIAIEKVPFILPPPKCDGFLCELGNCIQNTTVCNGIPDCRSGEDEAEEFCKLYNTGCHLSNSCNCAPDSLKCANEKCIPKEQFCNTVDDCGDLSDEPATCSCRSYLELTRPDQICDGVVNCFDRTDEDPNLCPCRFDGVKCGKTNLCISNDMVCDRHKDCPDGEDELFCMSFEPNKTSQDIGKVLVRVAGQWKNGCFPTILPQVELQEICTQLGFTDEITATRIMVDEDQQHTNSTLPIMDDFNYVWIHRSGKKSLKFRIRTGNEPYVTFQIDDQCNNLYIKCT